MNSETLEALKASIAKWERNAVADGPEEVVMGVDDCPLCDLFYSGEDRCAGCPVYAQTGARGCALSPYEDVFAAWEDWDATGEDEERDVFCAAARDEVAFLKSLLPQGEEVA